MGLTKATGMASLAPDLASLVRRPRIRFIGAGNLAESCYAEGAIGNKWVPNLRDMPADGIRTLAGDIDSIKRVKGTGLYVEYVLTWRDGRESPVNFRLDYGEWKIARLNQPGLK
ncbi:MAG: hypothetical protein IPJ28_12755 [Betaproteobacteria bacterium]|nr:hypothetical protein [Betaproteobacteria bacterium]